MMDLQTCSSSNHSRAYEPSAFFSPYNTPPYIATYTTYPPQLPATVAALPLKSDDANYLQQQMQHIRFPTPPITPPRHGNNNSSSNGVVPALDAARRTQSVIMKLAPQGEHVHTENYAHLDETLNSGSDSAATASPSSDFVCNWLDCGRYFENLELLAQHVTQLHAVPSLVDGLYYCRWSGCMRCDRGFNARYKMLVHVRTHTKEKPHQCHLCEKCFSRAENLKIHIRSHSGEKPYKCTFEGCQKAYSNSSDRFKHTRTHSMEKPYMCKVPGCQKRYTDPSSLRKHVKTFKHGVQMITHQQSLLSNNTRVSDNADTAHKNSTVHAPLAPPLDIGNGVIYQQCLLDSGEAAYIYLQQQQHQPHSARSLQATKQYYLEHNNAKQESNYWLPKSPVAYKYPATLAQQSYMRAEDYRMDIDLETPLDLRVNRN